MVADFNETFERVEKKYRLTAQQREALAPLLDAYLELGEFGKSVVTSFYLDTPNGDLICRSLEKPLYKEKIRVRHYGPIGSLKDSSAVFLEVKKKYAGVVYKRRIRLSWAATKAFLAGADYVQACTAFPLGEDAQRQEALSPRGLQIAREIEAFVHGHGPLEFSMSTACDRAAYVRRSASAADFPLSAAGAGAQGCLIEDDLRITFDDRIRYCDLKGPWKAEAEKLLLPAGESVMEIKARGSYPLWLCQALSRCGIKPASFSKYGEAFKASHVKGLAS